MMIILYSGGNTGLADRRVSADNFLVNSDHPYPIFGWLSRILWSNVRPRHYSCTRMSIVHGDFRCLGERKVMMTRKGPDSVDRIVGRNIRIYRLQKGLTQTELADQLDLTFQQVQKYEKGTNRVGSGRLLKIAIFLGVPVTALFKGSDEMADTDKQSIFDQLAKPHANRLLQAFARIDDDGLRRSVVQLVEEIAKDR